MSNNPIIEAVHSYLATTKDKQAKRRHVLEDAISECNLRALDEKYDDLWMYGDEPWNMFKV